MTDYTPSTEEVRNEYVRGADPSSWTEGPLGAEFDRWLAKEKADVLRRFREYLIDNQLAQYGIVLPDIAEIVDLLDQSADFIEKGNW